MTSVASCAVVEVASDPPPAGSPQLATMRMAGGTLAAEAAALLFQPGGMNHKAAKIE